MDVSTAIKLIIAGALILLSYQDFKQRAVHWILFPLLFALFSTLTMMEKGWQVWSEQLFINLLFIALHLVILTLYFSVRAGKLTSIFDRFIGWGDVLLLVVFSATLEPVVFLFFIVAGLLLVLSIYGVKIAFTRNTTELIPLAGCLGLFYLACAGISLFFPEALLFDQQSLLGLLYN